MSTEQHKKPKLPRKRKKAMINAQGRKSYYDTISLWLATIDNPLIHEPKCKFWVNSSIKNVPIMMPNGQVFMQMIPTKFW